MSVSTPFVDRQSFDAPVANGRMLAGGELLRGAFIAAPPYQLPSGTTLTVARDDKPSVLLIERGLAYRSFVLPDGRRMVVDVLLAGDFAGLDHTVCGHTRGEITAANNVAYRALSGQRLRGLMAGDARIALEVLVRLSEEQRRTERLTVSVARLDARERVVAFFLGLYDRLRARNLIAGATFDPHLTQEIIADHLGMTPVHLSRTLKQLREEQLLTRYRGLVTLLDLERLREISTGVPRCAWGAAEIMAEG